MCRFMLIHSTVALQPAALFDSFAAMCRQSGSMDRHGQRDGWGVAWLAEDNEWMLHKSLNPIWEDAGILAMTPPARAFAVHARSASFTKDRDILEFNQPYLAAGYAFTFNGLLRGVSSCA
jgi:predicted glutamine amidotransferase